MADTHNLTTSSQIHGAIPDDERFATQGGDSSCIAGVRFRGASRVAFFKTDDPEIRVGTWLFVETSQGKQAARVVITPRQLVLSQLRAPLAPIPQSADVANPAIEVQPDVTNSVDVDIENLKEPEYRDSRLIGGLGSQSPSKRYSPGASIYSHLSLENEQYKRAKQGLPQLGQRVSTREGEGLVVSLQVFNKLVTVRYDEPAREVVFAAAELPGVGLEKLPDTEQ